MMQRNKSTNEKRGTMGKIWKIVSFFIISILMTKAYAADGEVPNIVQCLGREEAIYLKNRMAGPNVNLNRDLINELITHEQIPIKNEVLKKICEPDSPTGFLTLQYFMTMRLDVLDFKDVDKINQKRYEQIFVEMTSKFPSMFLSYITALTAQAPTYDCLTKEIPEIDRYLDQYKYLENEVSGEKVLLNIDTIAKIFQKIKDYEKIFERCEEEKKQQEQNNKKEESKEKEEPLA